MAPERGTKFSDIKVWGDLADSKINLDLASDFVVGLLKEPNLAVREQLGVEAIKRSCKLVTDHETHMTVREMVNFVRDDTKNKYDREEASEVLGFLAQAVYLGMRHGDAPNDNRFKDALGRGSADSIDELLPESLKGLGEGVRNCMIQTPGVRDILTELDTIAYPLRLLPKSIKNKRMEGLLTRAVEGLGSLEPESSEQRAEIEMVAAYLGSELEAMSGINERVSGSVDQNRRGGVSGGRRRGYDGTVYGAPENMDRISPIPIPDDSLSEIGNIETIDGMRSWITQTLVKMSENPLFFANWWQSNVAGQLVDIASSRLGYGAYSEERSKVNNYTYAVLSVLGMQAVDRNADASSDNYGQFTPPKEMAHELHWDDGGEKYKLLKSEPVVEVMMSAIFKKAFDANKSWEVVKAFSGKRNYGTQNEFITGMIESGFLGDEFKKVKGKDRDDVIAKGRVAMAMFAVDWMPEWIRWANENKRAWAEGVRGAVDLPWLQSFLDKDKVRNAAIAEYDTYAYSGTLEAKVGDNKFEIGYHHPRILRPWDVAAGAKGSYRQRPEIIWAMERVLAPFIARRLSKANGSWMRASEENGIDRYAKYGKFMNECMGGPQGTEFDNLTTIEKLMPAASNFWGPGVNRNPEFGKFMADLFAVKVEAMFYPGYKSNADLVLNSIRGLDPYSGEKEKSMALEGAFGPSGRFLHGWVAEMNRLYGIDLLAIDENKNPKYPQFIDAYKRVFMDTGDVSEARAKYKEAINWLNQNRYFTVAGGTSEMFKVLFGMR